MKRNVKSGEGHPDELENFVKPLQNELTSHNVDVNIIRLHDLIQNRYALTHGEIHSQEEFMDSIGGYEFSPKSMYNNLVRTMMCQLKQTALKR